MVQGEGSGSLRAAREEQRPGCREKRPERERETEQKLKAGHKEVTRSWKRGARNTTANLPATRKGSVSGKQCAKSSEQKNK